MAEDDTFHIGLTMAGAISAGAYTGGVLDVLFEALDRHNARYEAGRNAGWQGEFAGHPRHKVALRVISGTSAGGVSAGLALAGLIGARGAEDAPGAPQIGRKRDGSFTSPAGYRYAYEYVLKPLHHVWVEALDLYRSDGAGEAGFLTLGDLDGDDPVGSALNSRHIDDAARAALAGISWNGKPYRFLTKDLDLFLTTTNLQGVPYEVGFTGGAEGGSHSHRMAQHSIVRHFRVSGLGTEPHASPWLEAWRDRGIALPITAGATIDFDRSGTPWARFKSAALATGAFPVGLAARVIEATASDFGVAGPGGEVTGSAWPVDQKPGIDPDTRPKPCLDRDDETPGPDGTVAYVAVDGGVANNEPFELARFTLRQLCPNPATGQRWERVDDVPVGDKYLASNPREANQATAAVIMIDPFPEGPTYSPLDTEEAGRLAGVMQAARRLFPALVNQARFKPGELIEATSGEIHSRFLLSPSRRLREGETDAAGRKGLPEHAPRLGADAIACGSFGGFGGFFDRGFRAHDYMLGRRNAHSFLKRYFVLSKGHVLLQLGDLQEAAGEPGMAAIVQPGPEFYAEDPPLPVWPRIAMTALEPILEQARSRISHVTRKLLKEMELSWGLRWAFAGIWSFPRAGAGRRITVALRAKVMEELIRRDQHDDFLELKPGVRFEPWQRTVLAAVAAAADDPIPIRLPENERRAVQARKKTPRDLAAAIEALPSDDRAGDDAILGFLDDPELGNRVWAEPARKGGPRYTLGSMRPSKGWELWSSATTRVTDLFRSPGADR